MREANQQAAIVSITVEEYIQYELTAGCRHEYINGQLIEMPGEKAINNRIARNLGFYLQQQLASKGAEAYINDVKVASGDKTKYFYPDVFVTKEPETEANEYIKYEPELIAEVVSPSSFITDTVDKYIAYSAIPSLKYYLLLQPQTVFATLYSKNAEGKWETTTFVSRDDIVPLPLLETELPLSEVYK